jgi:membrane protein
MFLPMTEARDRTEAVAGRGGRWFLRRAWDVLYDAIGHFLADDGWAMASYVALSALMALFPFLIFVATVAGSVGENSLVGQVVDLLFATWPHEVAEPIAAEVQRVLAPGYTNLLTISALIAAYLASNGVEAVRTALNRAYRVVDRRSIVFRRVQSLVFVIVGTVVVLAYAAFAVAVAALPALRPYQAGLALLLVAATTVLLIVALVVAHLFLPAARPRWTRLWPGILATLVLWVLSGWVFAFYLRRFSNMVATYAGLASVVTAIFFLYIAAVIMIFGAEFNAALSREDRRV